MNAFMFMLTTVVFTASGWLYDFEQAKQLAEKEDKLILLNFSGSDWCGPCIQMKRQVFETPEFQTFATERLVLVKADFPRQKKNQLDPAQKEHNERLAERYNPEGKFPLTLVLKADGTVIREWDGYAGASASDFVRQLRSLSDGK